VERIVEAIIASFQLYWTRDIQPNLAPVLTTILVAGVLLWIFYLVARRLRALATLAAGRTRADASTSLLIGRLTELATLTVGGLIVLSVLGVQIAALVAVLGAASLGITFATQDVLKNFVAGLYLLMERPFRIGQEVKVKDHVGRVEHVGIRTIVLRTEENTQVVIPNSLVFTEVIVNRDAYGGPIEKPSEEPVPDDTPAPNRPAAAP